MLKTTKKVTIEGKSIIDDVIVSNFVAAIDSDDPTQMTLSSVQLNKTAYKANREAVRADEAAFEDYAFAVQDSMLSENNKTEN